MNDSSKIIPERFRPALNDLLSAFEYARDSDADPWQFALDLSELKSNGATLADLRWLILRGFAEHARETTIPGDAERSFRKLPPPAFPSETCLVLSKSGAAALTRALRNSQQVRVRAATTPQSSAITPSKSLTTMRMTPEWDVVRRELRYNGKVIKRYRVPAASQEFVLQAFQEEGWPHCVDDPLPPAVNQDCKERLQATIKSLNRNQLKRLIRFHGNGSGQQVYWEPVIPRKRRK